MVSHPDNGHDDQPTCRSRRHEPGKAPLRASGIQICSICRDLAESALIELPELFELCAHALDLRPNGPRERVSGHRPRGIVLRDAVVTARSDILGVLAAWCGLVTTERGVLGPDELDIRKLVGFLAIHLHWLCQHPAGPDFVDELTDLTDAATEAMRPEMGFRVAAGTCLHPDCDRTVYAEAHREGVEPYEVSCEAGHVWAPEHWLSLRGKQNGTNGNGNGNNGTGANGNGNGGNGHATGNNGHVNGQANGHPANKTNGHPIDQTNGRSPRPPNGQVNGHAGGGQTNGHANGLSPDTNGHPNPPTGGQANGHSPQPPNGHPNGQVNGHQNGYSHGPPNGQVNGHRSPSEEGAE